MLDFLTKEGMTVQDFADAIGKPYSTAHRYLSNSKSAYKDQGVYFLQNDKEQT